MSQTGPSGPSGAPALVTNAGDKGQVQKAAENEKAGRQRDLNDLLWVLSDRRGRRFIWRLLAKCGVFKSSFTGNSTTFFNEGQREIGLWATADIMEARPEAYVEMIQEEKKENQNRA